MRYFLFLSYRGTHYHGWQSQPNAVTVQETIEKALTLLLKNPTEIVGAGRTDSGVHAREMYAHFDVENELHCPTLIAKLNSILPKDIAIHNIIKVENDAHARFDATKRSYEYHIHLQKSAFDFENSWYCKQPLDVQKMNAACPVLFEYEDFECFSKKHTDVHTFNCKIKEAHWQQNGDKLVFTIVADRFLRNMVRAIVGTMVDIGLGKITLEDFRKIIESKNRSQAGFSVPAQGLYLTKIEYDYIKK